MYFRLLHDEAPGAASYLLADLEAGEAVLIGPTRSDETEGRTARSQ